jgi:hypothetical protein
MPSAPQSQPPQTFLGKALATLATAAFAISLSTVIGFGASEFEGTWKVQDTKGHPFEITLSADGSAKADRAGEGLTGTWKEEGNGVVITWDTEWVTKITKAGNQYKKTAYEKGLPAGNASDAQKVE